MIGNIDVCKSLNLKPKIVYILPEKDSWKKKSDFKYIDFDEVAKSVKGHGDIGRELACYLRKWKTPPGQFPPGKSGCGDPHQ